MDMCCGSSFELSQTYIKNIQKSYLLSLFYFSKFKYVGKKNFDLVRLADRMHTAHSLMLNLSIVVVVVLLFYVHGKHLRSCRNGQ